MATTFSWHGGSSCNEKPIRDSGYTYGQEIPEEDVMKVAETIYKTGLNVMLLHSTSDCSQTLIAVDVGRFRQS